MGKRNNKTPQDQQGRRRSKRIKKCTYKGEALRKTVASTEEEGEDQLVVVLGNQKEQREYVAEVRDGKTGEEGDGDKLEIRNDDEADGGELDETCIFLNNVFKLHKLNFNLGRIVGSTEELMKSYSDEVLVKVDEDVEINEWEEGDQDMIKFHFELK